ncbi:uncharacterized protein [Eucyclogobius newberryi]|uniref:uncharacterized protein n=1 Tax=Eucyclogobius newberryi TaxID=166745 RepID=UPI003B5A7ECB
MSSNKDIILRKNQVISGYFGSYQIKELSGEGTYGRVARCIDQSTNQTVAIKIPRHQLSEETRHEALILWQVRALSKNINVVKFIASFQYQDRFCLVLEHLDQNLFDFMRRRRFRYLHLSEIRYITEQLLETFKELAKYKMIHGDLKPDNIMLVNHTLEPFKIKLIDFGFATSVRSLNPGDIIQTCSYRAPEASLGTKLDEAIDMWSLGCVMAFFFIGRNLFPGTCKYENMRMIIRILGMPDIQQLQEGLFTDHFFKKTRGFYHRNTAKEYTEKTGEPYNPSDDNESRYLTSLENMSVYQQKPISEEEMEAHWQFLDLLKNILQVNPAKRITPEEALTHPFIKQTNAAQAIASSPLETTNIKERKAVKTLTVHVEHVIQNEMGRKVTSTDVSCPTCMPKPTHGGTQRSPESTKRPSKRTVRKSTQSATQRSPESTKRPSKSTVRKSTQNGNQRSHEGTKRPSKSTVRKSTQSGNQRSPESTKRPSKSNVRKSTQNGNQRSHEGTKRPSKSNVRKSTQNGNQRSHEGTKRPSKSTVRKSTQSGNQRSHEGTKRPSKSTVRKSTQSGNQRSPESTKRPSKSTVRKSTQSGNQRSPESTKRPSKSNDLLERNTEHPLINNSMSASKSSGFVQNGHNSVWYSIVKVLVNTLMKKLFQYECGLDPKDKMYIAIADDLTQKVLKIYIPKEQVQQVDMSKKTFIIGVIKDLKNEFGPSHRLFKKATGEVESFVSSAVRFFQKNLQDIIKACIVWKL